MSDDWRRSAAVGDRALWVPPSATPAPTNGHGPISAEPVQPSAPVSADRPADTDRPVILPITRKGRIGEAMAWVIASLAWALSFASQMGLALQHGFHGFYQWEAIAMALLSDGVAAAMMFMSLDQAERGKSAKLTWVASIAAAGMMEWSNIAFALPDPVAVTLHAWPPLVASFTVFALVHIRRTNAAPRPARAEVIDQVPMAAPSPRLAAPSERALPRPESAPRSAPRRAPVSEPPAAPKARAQAAPKRRVPAAPKRVARNARQDQMRALLATPDGAALTSEEMGARLGIDAGYARKLRGEVERAQAQEENA